MWTWLLLTSTVLHGDATTATILASLKRPLLIALCRCLPAPHHCRVLDRFLAIGLTCVGSLNRLNPTDSGSYGFMVLSLFLAMSWACARMIKAATTKHGSASTLSGGMIIQPQGEKHCQRILLGGRSSPYLYGRKSGRISEIKKKTLAFFVTS